MLDLGEWPLRAKWPLPQCKQCIEPLQQSARVSTAMMVSSFIRCSAAYASRCHLCRLNLFSTDSVQGMLLHKHIGKPDVKLCNKPAALCICRPGMLEDATAKHAPIGLQHMLAADSPCSQRMPIIIQALKHAVIHVDDVHTLETKEAADSLHDERMASPELVACTKHTAATLAIPAQHPCAPCGLQADESHCTASFNHVAVYDLLHIVLHNLQRCFLFSAPLLGFKPLHASELQPDRADQRLFDCCHAMLPRRGIGDAQVW